MSAFLLQQRAKETGIRKILGASAAQLFVVLTKDFVRMIMIASLLSFPIAWWMMHAWLNNFAYRINIHWWIFFAGDALALLIALLTISVQAVKAAMVNPVEQLRSE